MKQYISCILMFVLLCTLLTACKGEAKHDSEVSSPQTQSTEKSDGPAKVDLCVDLNLGPNGSKLVTEFLEEFVPGYKEDFKANIELVPGGGPDRDATLTRIRTEMLTGKGPDLFICACYDAGDPDLGKETFTSLFPFPKAMMKRNMFLPLDGYIQNAQLMEWEDLYSKIMEAGRNDQGQMLLPLSWGMNFTTTDVEVYTPTEELPLTFDQMMESQDIGVIRAGFPSFFRDSLGEPCDYETEALTFTQEELASQLDALRLTFDRRTSDDLFAKPACFGRLNASHFCQSSPDSALIPLYNREGQATAYVNTFGAININSQVPDEAFQILDAFLSEDAQRTSELINVYFSGAPVCRNLLTKDTRVMTIVATTEHTYKSWYLSDWNYQQLQIVMDQLGTVDFITPVHQELSTLTRTYFRAKSEEERQKLIIDAYSTMKMMLAES